MGLDRPVLILHSSQATLGQFNHVGHVRALGQTYELAQYGLYKY